MKEIIFDIKNFSYLTGELPDVSFIPMMTRRKLDNFGRAALCTLYKVFKNNEVALVFSSCFGDFERVKKLTTQLKEEGEVSPAGFSASVHNASVGLFSILEKIKTGYNAISAGEKSFAYGLLEGILTTKEQDCIYCYTEDFDEVKSLSVLLVQAADGEFLLREKSENAEVSDTFEDFVKFLNDEKEFFVSDIFEIARVNR